MGLRDRPEASEDVLADLLKMSPDQAHLFRLVTNRGPVTAAEAAKALGRNRARGYEILRDLVRAGLMIEVPGRPLRYEVVSVHQLLADKQQELAEQAVRLAAAREALPADAGPLLGSNRVAIVEGLEEALKQAALLVRRAESEVFLVGKECLDAPNSNLVLHALKGQTGGTCSVSLYLENDAEEGARKAAKDATGQAPVLYDASGFPDLAGVATEHGVLFLVPESTRNAGSRVGVHVESQVIGEFVCLAVKHLLHPAKSLPVQDAEDDSFLNKYKRALAEARRSIDIMVGTGWIGRWPEPEIQELGRLYVAAVQRKVQVRFLIQNSMPEMLAAWQTGVMQAVRMRTLDAVPLLLCIVDDQTVLKAVGDGDRVVNVVHQDPNEVRFSHEVFNGFWDKATPVDKSTPDRNVGGTRTTKGPGPAS